MTDIVERLRSSAPLPLCPFERRSPEYWTTPNDKPCKFCGGLPEGPDKCTGADMRILLEAADLIERYRTALEWYAKPEIYRPHPHGPAFDRRDLSWHAKAALSPAKQAEGQTQ